MLLGKGKQHDERAEDKKKANKKKLILCMFIIVIIVIVSIGIYLYRLINAPIIYNGIYINEINVGGLTREEAISELLDFSIDKYSHTKLILNYQGNQWPIPLSNISYRLDVEKSVDKAYNIGRDGGVIKKLRSIRKLPDNPQSILPDILYDKEMLNKILVSVGSQINTEPLDAIAEYKNGKVVVTPHKDGLKLDEVRTQKNIELSLQEQKFEMMDLMVESVPAKVKKDMLDRIDTSLASFSTAFNSSNITRTHNIKIACSRLHTMVLYPGDIFSMDRALGSRTAENGYQGAKIILNNELVEGIGGGICQVTSTMYNSVLLSGLEIIERKNHSLPLSYIEIGRDATIAEGNIDFKFQNSFDYAIMITAFVEGNNISIGILGRKPDEKLTYKIRTMVLEEIKPEGIEIEIDDSLPPYAAETVRPSVSGYRVAVYRDTYNSNGALTASSKISEDYYKPQKQKIKISSSYSKNKTELLNE